jgi:hypothetical protein
MPENAWLAELFRGFMDHRLYSDKNNYKNNSFI